MTATAQAAVSGLCDAVSTVLDRNDLGRLARMHSWCQALVEAASAGDEGVTPEVHRLAERLLVLLEQLILDEAVDAELGITLVPPAVALIQRAAQGEPIEADELFAQIGAAVGDVTAGKEAVHRAEAGAVPPRTPSPPRVVVQPPPAVAVSTPAVAPAMRAAPPSPPAPSPSDATATVAAAASGPSPAAAPSGSPLAEAQIGEADSAYVSEPLMLDLNEAEHLEGFLDEAAEHMDAIETGLLEVEADPTDTGKINELFRPFHTIKGIAGFLNLRDINRLTHEIETILDLGRKNELKITAATVDLILQSVDVLKAQLAAIRAYLAAPTGGPCPQPAVAEIMTRLRQAARPGSGGNDAAAPRPKLGQILVAEGAVAESDVQSALNDQKGAPGSPRKLGEILVERGAAAPGEVEKALVQQAAGAPLADTSIRVDTAKLDLLVDAVGELVIAQSMVSMTEAVTQNEKLHRNVSQVTKIVRDVQETAMAMRMVPIGQTFQKMRRVVRDVSRKAGKQVELTIAGEDTELDKNVIQQMSDPLVHMVRNAVDHGIESPEGRRQAGKPEVGQVFLNAYHQGDSIVIEIRDDGRGLDRDKLIAKGIERGLITPDDQLSDQQVYAMILQSGFSTAEQVTDISGRGVGMDVVRRNVEQLRGKIEIQSEKGRGSTFLIRLPLTLAIIDGMLVKVGEERMIIPTILIEQSLRPERKQITSVQRRGAMLQVRGELCPLVQLAALFGAGEAIDPCEHLVVLVQCEGQKVALVVSELIGQQQVVIKTLGQRFKHVRGVSGAAILGDGRVGVILEPTGVLALHTLRASPCYHATPVVKTMDQKAVAVAAATQETLNERGTGLRAEPQPAAASV